MSTLTVKRCDYCKIIIEGRSLPSKEEYNNAAVRVNGDISILLPPDIAREKSKPGESISHAAFIKSSDYCSLSCFLRRIYDIIPWDKTWESSHPNNTINLQ